MKYGYFNRKKQKRKRTSLKWKLISSMLLYWLLPFLVIIGTIGAYLFTSQEKNQMERLFSQAELNVGTAVERLEGAVADCRQATYDRTLYEKYREYKWGDINERAFDNNMQLYLDGQYTHKKYNTITGLILLENPEDKAYTSCNYATGGSFAQIQTLINEDREKLLETAESLDTAVGFVKCGERLYIVRNMVDKNFEPWGILVSRVNREYCFETLLNYGKEFLVCVELNGQSIVQTGTEEDWEDIPDFDKEQKTEYLFYKDRVFGQSGQKNGDFSLRLILNAKKKDLFIPLYGYTYMAFVMMLFLIPMLYLFLCMSRKYISKPVERMMLGAEQIEKENLGYQMEEDTGSLEFEYLQDSFNKMSSKLKYQFDHIYEEELALRDAKIMALQSHINPHFMNNTLEIINWEARLSGNEKVSKMIGALSTLMDAAIDRKKMPEVRLSEEMSYVNAYLYITGERLGKRLTVTKDIPEEIMHELVPRLIMRPIIENAIKHGIVPRGGGSVAIFGRRDDKYIYLDIINDGGVSEEDAGRIERLLSPDYDSSHEPSGNMGIANVNQRLKILYGEECGLEIKGLEKDRTISTLTILAHR